MGPSKHERCVCCIKDATTVRLDYQTGLSTHDCIPPSLVCRTLIPFRSGVEVRTSAPKKASLS